MIVALVPFKGLDAGKSRLSQALEPEERRGLIDRMLRHVLAELSESAAVNRVLTIALEPVDGFDNVADPGTGLNDAVSAGLNSSFDAGASAAIVIPADLPYLSGGDIDALVDELPHHGAVAPSKDGGTGGLLVSSGGLIQPTFGPGSSLGHISSFRSRGIEPAIIHRSGLAIDIDVPDDLDLLGDQLLDIAWRRDSDDRRSRVYGTHQTGKDLSRADL